MIKEKTQPIVDVNISYKHFSVQYDRMRQPAFEINKQKKHRYIASAAVPDCQHWFM